MKVEVVLGYVSRTEGAVDRVAYINLRFLQKESRMAKQWGPQSPKQV
jgi:hypothetical protein